MTRDEVLRKIGSLSKGEERAKLLEDENVRNTVLRQIITACADGAIAVNDIVTHK